MFAAIVVASLGGLGACGFEPVYGHSSPVRHAELATIKVTPIKGRASPGAISDGNSGLGRAGYELRNRLITMLGTEGVKPRFELGVMIEESQGEFAIQADDRVTRYQLVLSASFTLLEIDSGKTVYSGGARSVGSYNVVDSEFATVASEADTRKRAAIDLADSIRELLIAHFSREDTAEATP